MANIKFTRARDGLRLRIQRGEIKPGERLPSHLTLCEQYDLTEHSIKLAINALTDEGYVITESGRGRWVNRRESWPKDLQWTRKNTPRCRDGQEPWFASFTPKSGHWRPECVTGDAEALRHGRQRRQLHDIPSTAVWEDYWIPGKPKTTHTR